MKILASTIEKLFTPYVLLALNIAIILVAEFSGGGEYFAKTGLAYGIGVVFVGLIITRIFSDYAFGDYILKGFLKIQLTFLLLLGLVQFYEFMALNVFMLRPDVVQLTVVASYFVWLLSIFLSLGFVFRIYYKQSIMVLATMWGLFGLCVVGLIAPSLSPAVVAWFPVWFPKLILAGIVFSGALGILATRKLCQIMPVFTQYSNYATPASIFLILTGFSEYFEATGTLQAFGVTSVQNVYFSHFFVYAALSLLLIAFGKLKRPQGIYADM